jgi:hypothetical protein
MSQWSSAQATYGPGPGIGLQRGATVYSGDLQSALAQGPDGQPQQQVNQTGQQGYAAISPPPQGQQPGQPQTQGQQAFVGVQAQPGFAAQQPPAQQQPQQWNTAPVVPTQEFQQLDVSGGSAAGSAGQPTADRGTTDQPAAMAGQAGVAQQGAAAPAVVGEAAAAVVAPRGAPEPPVAISVTAEEATQLLGLRNVVVPTTPTSHMAPEQIRAENEQLRILIAQFQRLQEVQASRVRVHLTAEFGRTAELQRQIEALQNDAANLLKERNILGGDRKKGSGSQRALQQQR